MALVVKDRVRETTATTGTGTVSLAGPVTGFQSFSVIGDTNTTYYAIVDAATGDWEVGIGTYTLSGTTLSRDTVLESSNSGALVPFIAGTKDVFCTYPADTSVSDGKTNVIEVNSTDAALRITQTGTGDALVVEDETNPDSSPFVVDTLGRVLNGSSISYDLPYPATGTQTSPFYQQHGASTSTSMAGITSWSTGGQAGGALVLAHSMSGAIGTPGAIGVDNSIGFISFAGDDGTKFIQAASIEAEVDGTPGTNDMPGRLVFSTTADGTSTPVERMRISSDGRLQINGENGLASSLVATANTFPLNLAQTAYQFRAEATFGTANTNAVGFGSTYQLPATGAFSSSYQFFAGTLTSGGATLTNNYGVYVDSQSVGTNIYGVSSNIAAGTNRWNFYVGGDADNYFAGDVGIGTTAPEYRLDVTSTDNVTTTIAMSVQNSSRNYGLGIGAYTMSNRNIGGVATTIDYTFDIGGNAIFNTGGSQRMSITALGEVLVNTTTEIASSTGAITIGQAGSPDLIFFRDDTNVVAGNTFGEISFFGNDTTSNAPTRHAYITGVASGTHAAGDNPTDISFGTTPDGSSTVAEAMRITWAKNLKIGGTALRATTEGTNQLVMFNGTAPVGTLTNGVSFYSASGEARVMDAAGNSTLLSPHDQATNEWIFHSKHTPTGKVLRIDVEKMLRFINDHFGLDMIQEFTEE